MMSVILVDDSRLFVKVVEVPSELSSSDVVEFAQNEIESTPLWTPDKSFSFYQKGTSVCLYAGSTDNIFDDISAEEISSAKLIVPASAVFCSFNLQGVCVLEDEFSVCAILFENGSIKNIASCSVLGDDFKTAISNALLLAGIDSSVEVKRYKFESIKTSFNKLNATLLCLDDNGDTLETLSLTQKISAFATAELRDVQQLKSVRSAMVNRVVKKFFVWLVPVVVLFMIGYQGKLVLEQRELDNLVVELAKIEPRAKQIEAQSAEIAKLATFKGKKMRPIETLALVNSMRPDDVFFERVTQENINSMQLAGSADSITSVKTFVDTINNSGTFSAKMDSDTSRGKTRFTITLQRR